MKRWTVRPRGGHPTPAPGGPGPATPHPWVEEQQTPPGAVPAAPSVRTVQALITDITRDDEYTKILKYLPEKLRPLVEQYLYEVDEIKMSAGNNVFLRMHGVHLQYPVMIDRADLDFVEQAVEFFKSNNRKGVPGTLHRVSQRKNDSGIADGIVFRVGRLLRGVAEPFRDVIQTARGIGICGMPASGKTTWLRDAILIDGERVIGGINVVDTSNELCGEGDGMNHPAFRNVVQNKVGDPENLIRVLRGAIRNEGSVKIYADEVGYQAGDVELVTQANRQVRSTTSSVHGETLTNCLENDLLLPLFGLGKDAANRRIVVGNPAFEMFIEIRSRGHFVLHRNLKDSVARILMGAEPITETVLYAS